MTFENIFNRVWSNDVTESGQSALDSVVTPGGVLPRHA